MRLRHSARGLIVDPSDSLLLYHVQLSDSTVLWAAPGGGLEAGETTLDALRRELAEETGLEPAGEPRHVWHQRVVDGRVLPGYDGVVNDYFLVRAPRFTPRGTLSASRLAAENVGGFRWWPLDELTAYAGTDLFSPRALGELLPAVLTAPPSEPLLLGV